MSDSGFLIATRAFIGLMFEQLSCGQAWSHSLVPPPVTSAAREVIWGTPCVEQIVHLVA